MAQSPTFAQLDVYEFNGFPQLMAHLQAQFPGRKAKMSLAQAARKFGFRSPRAIAMLTKGTRAPSAELLQRLSRTLDLSDGEFRYVQLLAAKQRHALKGLNTSMIDEELKRLCPSRIYKEKLSNAAFAHIAQWHSVVIVQMFESPKAPKTAKEISDRLKGRVSEEEVVSTLENLCFLGLLERHERTWRVSKQIPRLFGENTVSSLAVRSYHKQNLERAKVALDEQSLETRSFQSATLRISPAKIPAIKRELQSLLQELCLRYHDSSASAIYQLMPILFRQDA